MRSKVKFFILVTCLVLAAGCLIIVVSNDNKKDFPYPCSYAVPEEFELPNGRLVAVGTATHGNAEPFVATLDILKKIYAQHGSVAFILEENAGEAEIINEQHSYSGELSKCAGMYAVYGNQEMEDILRWLEEEQLRFYGIDIQDISATVDILSARLEKMGFPDTEKVLSLRVADQKTIEENGLYLDTISPFVNEKYERGTVSVQEYKYLLHLIDCIKMNYSYILSGEQFAIRDEMMAKNVQWVMDYEHEFYDNNYAVLSTHIGHAMKCEWHSSITKQDYHPMGMILSEIFEKDFYVIATDAAENYFEAMSNSGSAYKKKVFHISKKSLPPFLGTEKTLFLTREDMLKNGVADWDLTIVGAVFGLANSLTRETYEIPVSIDECFDALLFFPQMTPVHNINN